MSVTGQQDWNPETYDRFRGFRLRPALDLMQQVGQLPPGNLVDLGCGSGAAGRALAAQWPGRRVCGVDSSPAMLDRAAEAGTYHDLTLADATAWHPPAAPALIFANALCHWLGDHPALFRRLAGFLPPGGVLAVQMPRQYFAPSHALLRAIAGQMFPSKFDFRSWQAPVAPPGEYARMLAPLGSVSIWETEYLHRLDAVQEGHPVRAFTESTALRPFADRLSAAELAVFVAAYDLALAAHYPCEYDGSVLFSFRRLFFVLRAPS